jgi:hypothetical protein
MHAAIEELLSVSACRDQTNPPRSLPNAPIHPAPLFPLLFAANLQRKVPFLFSTDKAR